LRYLRFYPHGCLLVQGSLPDIVNVRQGDSLSCDYWLFVIAGQEPNSE
jgi:hypothetical protein